MYVEASMQCDKKRTTRWAGSKWTAWLLSLAAWMCNSCSLAAGLLGSLVARQLSRLTAWQLYIYICKYIYIYICSMMYKFIILCGRYRFFFYSLSFYNGLDMFLATRDALVINGRCQVFFTISGGNIFIEGLRLKRFT